MMKGIKRIAIVGKVTEADSPGDGSEIRVEPWKGDGQEMQSLRLKLEQATRKLARQSKKHFKVERDLRLAEEKYRIVVEYAGEAITILDLRGKIREVNNGALRLHKYGGRDELLGHDALELIIPGEHPVVRDHFKKILNGEDPLTVEYTFLNKDGSTFRGEISMSLLKDKSGTAVGVLNIARDITVRKREEDELRLRAELLDSANDCIYVIDDLSRFIYANETTFKALGYAREEFFRLTLDDIVAPQYREQTEQKREFVTKTRSDFFESASIRKDGSVFPCEINSRLFEMGGRRYYLSIARDVSRRNQIYKELQDREEKLQSLMDAMPVAICCVDSSDNRISYINKKFVELFGYCADDIPTLQHLIDLAQPAPVLMAYHLSPESEIQGDGSKPIETAVTRKNGAMCYTTAAFNSIAGQEIAIFMDITDKKKADEEIKQIHEKLVAYVNELGERERQNRILSEMRDLLQVSATVAEISPIITKSVGELFPLLEGALFLMSPSRSDLEAVARWGDFPDDTEDNVFQPDECWGLRRGRIFMVDDVSHGPICSHLKHISSTTYACLPLMAKGEVLGLLHLRSKKSLDLEEARKQIAASMDVGVTLAEYLSLSIANIKLRETLANQSIRDSLTGLYNRRYMEEAIQHEIMRAERKQASIGIMMMDIDHFKDFNDNYGHKAGDALLIQLAYFLKSSLRGSDIVCRYGGEEFIVILPETSVQVTKDRAETLREDLKKMQVYYHNEVLPSVSISIGIAAYPDNCTNVDELFSMADGALYRAKQEGRDRVNLA